MTTLIALLFALPAVVFSAEHEVMNLAAVGAPMPELQLYQFHGASDRPSGPSRRTGNRCRRPSFE